MIRTRRARSAFGCSRQAKNQGEPWSHGAGLRQRRHRHHADDRPRLPGEL